MMKHLSYCKGSLVNKYLLLFGFCKKSVKLLLLEILPILVLGYLDYESVNNEHRNDLSENLLSALSYEYSKRTPFRAFHRRILSIRGGEGAGALFLYY